MAVNHAAQRSLDLCLPVFFSSHSYLIGEDADEELCAVCFSLGENIFHGV